MIANQILETVLYADDIAAAEGFYVTVLGLVRRSAAADRFVFLACGSQMLLIFNPSLSTAPDTESGIPRHGCIGAGHVCFAAPDAAALDNWRARFAAAGVPVEHEHIWPGGGRSIYIRDPAGNSVEFAEPRIWGF